MGERGRVISLSENLATISFMRTEACAKCRACMAGFSESEMILEAKNSLGAQKGDLVEIELPDKGFFTASVVMYLIPLLSMLAGFLGGSYFAGTFGYPHDITAFASGIALLALSFVIIRLNEKKFKSLPMFLPQIVKILSDNRK